MNKIYTTYKAHKNEFDYQNYQWVSNSYLFSISILKNKNSKDLIFDMNLKLTFVGSSFQIWKSNYHLDEYLVFMYE